MITEIGHFSLILALCVAVLQAVVPLAGATQRRPGADRMGAAGGADAVPVRRDRVPRADLRLRRLRFLGRQCRGELEQHEAAASTKSAACGATTRARCSCGCSSWRCSAPRSRCSAATAAAAAGARARGAGDDRRRLSLVHPVHVEPVRCGSFRRRSKAPGSIRSCRIPASRFIRRFSISAMSGSRSRSASPPPR